MSLWSRISYAPERPQGNSNAEGRAGHGCWFWASFGELLFYGGKRWPDEDARHSSGEKTGKETKTSGSTEAGVCQRVMMTRTVNVMELETRMGQDSVGTTDGMRSSRHCGRCRWPAWPVLAWCSRPSSKSSCFDAVTFVSQLQGESVSTCLTELSVDQQGTEKKQCFHPDIGDYRRRQLNELLFPTPRRTKNGRKAL